MAGIRTNAAAEVLGVSPNTLRSWERRYGFPKPRRTLGNHRHYELLELQTLRDALAQTGNISSAVELARQRQAAPANGDGRSRPSRPSTRARPTGRWRRAWRSARSSGRSRSCCCRRRPPRRRPRSRRRARVRLPLGDGLAARRPPSRLRRLAPGRDPAARLEPGPGRRGGPRPGARPDPAPRRLPGPDALQRARRGAARAGPRRARPDRDRPLRPRRRHRRPR